MSNGEAFWSHVLDLRGRLDEAGLDAAAVADERVTAKGVAPEARRKVFKRALTNNEPSVPMIQTPKVRLAQRAANGDPAALLAARRVALTVAVFMQECCADSSGYLGEVAQRAILVYAWTDWRVTGIAASTYWQDLLEYLVWEDYGLTQGVEQDILAAAGASAARDTCVRILEGLDREWAQARARYSAGNARSWLDRVLAI